MELYKKLAAVKCFSREELSIITGSEGAADWYIRSYSEKGYIERVRRDLYAVISLETGQPIPNRYQIASLLSDDSYVSHHSALEYYGYANQVFYTLFFSTEKKVRPFSYDGIDYQPIGFHGTVGVIDTTEGVRVTSLERTVIDCISDFKNAGGIEELLRCLELIPFLSHDKLLEALEIYNCGKLYQKTGYILEFFKNEMYLSESFFCECEKHISGSKSYLFEKKKDFILHKRWKLFAPKDLRSITDKGIYRDAV